MLKIVTIIITIALMSAPGIADEKKTLGFTTKEYDYEFNKFVQKDLNYSWGLYSDLSEYEDINGITEMTTSCVNSDETICLVITRNRKNHEITGIMAFIGGNGIQMLAGMTAVLNAATPSLMASERGKILKLTAMKAVDDFSEDKKSSTAPTTYDGVTYSAHASKLLGFMFSIYLSDNE